MPPVCLPCIFEMSQMMQVVSMEEVPMMFGSCSFQSKDVSGAQNSVFLLLLSRASNRTDLLSITFHKRR